MSETIERNAKRLKTELRGLARAYKDLADADDDTDAHLAWANFVRHLKLSINLLVRIGKEYPERRALAYRFRNFTDSHELVNYMVGSRNDIDHPEDESKDELIAGKLERRHTDVSIKGFGSLAKIGANSSISVLNSSFNGTPINGFVHTDADTVPKAYGDLEVKDIPKSFRVGSIRTARGEIVPVPLNREGRVAYTGNEIADFGMRWLRQAVEVLLPEEERQKLDPFPQLDLREKEK